MPVNAKKLPSTAVMLGGTMKSETMLGSPAIAIWTMANEATDREKRRLIILEAMVESLKTRIWCQDFEEDGIYGGECRLGDCGHHDFWPIIPIQKAQTDQNP